VKQNREHILDLFYLSQERMNDALLDGDLEGAELEKELQRAQREAFEAAPIEN
jgi:hypothetical protein